LYSSPDIIRQIKSRRMRWAGHVARMGEREECTGRWWESPKEGDHLKELGVDGRMGLGRIVGRWVGGCGVGLLCSGWGPLAGSCECVDEPSGSGATELVIISVSFMNTTECPGTEQQAVAKHRALINVKRKLFACL
jgi:hypothetical protein